MQQPEITRIDFVETPGGFIVNKLAKVDDRFIVISHQTKGTDFDLGAALAWCEKNRWVVRRWPGGARAFKNGLYPIRTAGAIKKLRDQLKAHPDSSLNGTLYAIDLRYDY